jgi:hypothetical protein
MSNSLLTVQQITREALRVLHQKANFLATINRQYDDSFAKSGAKIGQTLKVRLPNQYVIRNGPVLNPQDTVEQYVPLTVSTQMGVDMNFTSVDLTMSLDDFSSRIITPAVSVLVANVENTVINAVAWQVFNAVFNKGATCTLKQILQGRKVLSDSLAPLDRRTANLNTQDTVDLQTDVKGLFNDQVTLGRQYVEGVIGRTSGFDFYENTLWPAFVAGAGAGYTTNTNNFTQGQTTLTVAAGAGALVTGDVFTIAGVFRVHPESKVSTGQLQAFTVTAPYAGGAGAVSISPTIYTTGGQQNVTVPAPAAGAALTFQTTTAVTGCGTSMLYQEDAFTFATADLVMPKGVDFAYRETMDGVSMRIVRAYDITNDKFPCRLDILFGQAALRPQLAVRLHNN